MKKKKNKNLNYDFSVQNQPAKRMGGNSHANLPSDPINRPYAGPTYRQGVINSFSASVTATSGIDENGCYYGND